MSGGEKLPRLSTEFFWLSNHNLILDGNTGRLSSTEKEGGVNEEDEQPYGLRLEDLSKTNADALTMKERGNEMKVTKRGKKIDEGAEREKASTNPPPLTAPPL